MAPTISVLALASIPLVAQGYNNGMAPRPPMGWNTWCTDDICGLIDRCTEAEVFINKLKDIFILDFGFLKDFKIFDF